MPRWAVEADLCIEMGWTRQEFDAQPEWWIERLLCLRELRRVAQRKASGG